MGFKRSRVRIPPARSCLTNRPRCHSRTNSMARFGGISPDPQLECSVTQRHLGAVGRTLRLPRARSDERRTFQSDIHPRVQSRKCLCARKKSKNGNGPQELFWLLHAVATKVIGRGRTGTKRKET